MIPKYVAKGARARETKTKEEMMPIRVIYLFRAMISPMLRSRS